MDPVSEDCFVFVEESLGLDVCHQADPRNETRIQEFLDGFPAGCMTSFSHCTQYTFPEWLPPLVKFLWFLFACQIIICSLWMYFFWTTAGYRHSIFRFKHERMTRGTSVDCLDRQCNLPSETDHSLSISHLPDPLKLKPLKPLKGTFLPPEIETSNDRYKLRDFMFKDAVTSETIVFGHKIFHLPTFRLKCLKTLDASISPRSRIILSFLIIYSSLIALVADYFIDIMFLQGLSSDTLIDVKYIHFEYGALIAMVIFEFTAFFCLPMTAFVFHKMSWSHNLQTNLIGEVIIISLQYLMEDGPELVLQYYFVDMYAGTKYKYPDGVIFSGRSIVVMSSLASLTVAIIGVANLASLYQEVQFWLTLRAVRDYLNQDNWTLFAIKQLPSIVWELKRHADEDDLVERARHDIRRIEKRCRQISNENKKLKSQRSARRDKTFRTKLRRIKTNVVNRPDNKRIIEDIKRSNNSSQKLKIIRVLMLIVGLIPFLVNLCRLGAAANQIFVFRKYRTGCLRYVTDPSMNTTTINQPRMTSTECWGWVEYPFFILNSVGLILHSILLIGIGIGKVFETKVNKELIDVIDSDDSDSSSESDIELLNEQMEVDDVFDKETNGVGVQETDEVGVQVTDEFGVGETDEVGLQVTDEFGVGETNEVGVQETDEVGVQETDDVGVRETNQVDRETNQETDKRNVDLIPTNIT